MPIVKQTQGGSPSHVVVRSIALTPAVLEILESLAADIAGRTTRKPSVSAVVRALLRMTQETPDLRDRLAELVDREQKTEVVWGKPPRARPPG
jgi:hypothetical protein